MYRPLASAMALALFLPPFGAAVAREKVDSIAGISCDIVLEAGRACLDNNGNLAVRDQRALAFARVIFANVDFTNAVSCEGRSYRSKAGKLVACEAHGELSIAGSVFLKGAR